MQTYGLQTLEQKFRNAIALIGHLAWIVCPALWLPPLMTIPAAAAAALYDLNPLFWGSIAVGVGILIWCGAELALIFWSQWILIFLCWRVDYFQAGSARYLLPIALFIAILATHRLSLRWQRIGFAAGF